MSEPDAASSDARNIRTTIVRDGDSYLINGRKWFTTGALHPNCQLAIVMGVTGDNSEPGSLARHSMVLVPMNAPGLRILRNIPIMNHHSPEGHCELLFQNVRVPVSNLLGEVGEGFWLAQERLGRAAYHCMRSIGQCEVALDLMCERALERKVFGKHLAEFANIQDWIAESRLEIDQARLLVLNAAHRMDREGNAAARVDVSAIKVVAARLQTRVLDRAMQVFGAMGLTPDTPLSYLWTWGRALRFLDGPDEVHLRVVARSELSRAKANVGQNSAYFVPPGALA
jgi:acyl-CoA dehydrogenase